MNPFAIQLVKKNYKGVDNLLLSYDYSQFPPIYIRGGRNELILDEILEFIKLLKKFKVNVKHKIVDNMPHAFDIFHGYLPEFNSQFDELIQVLIKMSLGVNL